MKGAVSWLDGAFRYEERLFDLSEYHNSTQSMSFLCAVRQSREPSAMAEVTTSRATTPPLPTPEPTQPQPQKTGITESTEIKDDVAAPPNSFSVQRLTDFSSHWYYIEITSKLDKVDINNFEFNRGNCNPDARPEFPYHLVYGGVLTIRWFIRCKPIAIRIQTSVGYAEFEFDN